MRNDRFYLNDGKEAREVLEEMVSRRSMPSLVAYTDGCSHPKFYPHNGGWGYLILEGDKNHHAIDDILAECCGGKTQTTNNEMEMTAILRALEWVPEGCDVNVLSDSQISINICRYGHSNKEELQGLCDGIQELVRSKRLHVRYTWVKGHDADDFNNRADILSNLGCNTYDLIYGLDRTKS